MISGWADFYIAIAGAAAALTGLLFVAVALRPREIRNSTLMIGRARSAFYAFITVLFVALLALTDTDSRLIGLAEIGVAVGVFALSSTFTLRAMRARTLNLRRAAVYHAGLVMVVIAGVVRAIQGKGRDSDLLLAVAVLLLLAIALSNSWQLVISHEAEPEPEGDF
jgi:modulator of FtsH protease